VSRRLALLALIALGALAASAPPAFAIAHAPPSFFGVIADGPLSTVRERPRLLDRELDRMAVAGVGTVRAPFWWSALQPVRPGTGPVPTRWRPVDRLVAEAARRRIAVLPVILGSPPWAAAHPFAKISRPSDLGAFGDFLQTLAARYGSRGSLWERLRKKGIRPRPIRRWQIWNEPQFEGYWGGPDWQASYIQALAAARRGLKKADPRAQVVLAGLTNMGWRDLAGLYRAGVRPHFDLAAVQTFTARPESVLTAARLTRRVMTRNGDGAKPLLLTEVAWAATRGRPGLRLPTIQVSPTAQARNLEALFALAEANRHALGLDGVVWATWLSSYAATRTVFDYTGLRRYDRRSGRATSMPALGAFRRVARAGD
jgi:hypothetical protein